MKNQRHLWVAGSGCGSRTREDIAVVFDKDPAATSVWEVLFYPHLHALWLQGLAHHFYHKGHRLGPRLIALYARFISGGIDIHPGATIGRRFFIDHGSGVVIGETTVIGDDVMLYHAGTLGATGWWKDMKRGRGSKRHPTVEDQVVIGTGATILGPFTIGAQQDRGAGPRPRIAAGRLHRARLPGSIIHRSAEDTITAVEQARQRLAEPCDRTL